ncbi:hypothetical protein HDU97_005719 [Phlyctochytrium planicorne]|nr:hypothetical protein HDU97_005719 [Phlyctochytrium planicorne]
MHLSTILITVGSFAVAAFGQDPIISEVNDPIPVYKNVKTGQICGSWISRDNGVAKYFKYECSNGDRCNYAYLYTQVGTCEEGPATPAVGVITFDGTCGVTLSTDNFGNAIPKYTFCDNQEACVVPKGELKGTCQKKNGSNKFPTVKDDYSTAQLNQKCGAWLTPGKLNRAQCAAGLYCQYGDGFTGTCYATYPPYFYKNPNPYTCGYSSYPGYYSVCEKNDCVFLDKTSMSGFCLSAKSITFPLPSSTDSFPTFTEVPTFTETSFPTVTGTPIFVPSGSKVPGTLAVTATFGTATPTPFRR